MEVTAIAQQATGANSRASTTNWEEVYRSVGPQLLRHLERLAGPDACADLVQECFVKAMRSSKLPESEDERRYWLFRIATNLAIDHLRKRQRWASLGSMLRMLGTEEMSSNVDEQELTRAALAQIPREQAEALVLRLGEGLRPSEVARAQGVSDSAVKSRLARGRLNFAAAYRRLERQ